MSELKLYSELAEWWPLLSRADDYAEEAEIFRKTIVDNASTPPVTMLELGSGGGNNASHLKRHFELTLVDRSPGMLRVSNELNPNCEHYRGDMRYVRLGLEFDVVFIHDAIVYMTTREDLAQAIETAFIHCRPGGLALFVPDHTKEDFRPETSHGGHDAGERGMRSLEWTVDDDPEDETYRTLMVYLLREGREIRSVLDEHMCGLFSRGQWMEIIASSGFQPMMLPYDHSEFEPGLHCMFMGRKEMA